MQFHLKYGQHQREAETLIRAGLKRLAATTLGTNVVVCWGWRAGRQWRRLGMDVLVLERGYLGDRFAYTSIAWNGLNNRANFPDYPPDGGARFASMGLTLARPRCYENGQHVLLVGQVSGDMSLGGRNLSPWYAETARDAALAYGLPVLFRPHPEEVKRKRRTIVPGYQTDTGTLTDALAGAAVVLTWNSNTAVEALVAGVPTVCCDAGAMAWPVAGHHLGDLTRWEAREAWAHALAWKQWRAEEIASGEALVGVVDRLRAVA